MLRNKLNISGDYLFSVYCRPTSDERWREALRKLREQIDGNGMINTHDCIMGWPTLHGRLHYVSLKVEITTCRQFIWAYTKFLWTVAAEGKLW